MSSRSTQIVGGPSREHAFVDAVTNALLVKVVNPSGGGGGGGGSVNISEVGGTPIGTEVPILSRGRVSTVNATTTPLGANATYTGTWEQVVDFATLTVTVFSNVASATGGMRFEWSSNGTNTDETEAVTISAAHPGRAMSFNVRGRYFRIVYVNGGTAQTTFRLGTVFRTSGGGTNNHTITETLEDTTLAIMTRSVIVGQTTGGGGGYHNVKVTPSGALTTEVNDGGGSLTVDGTVAVTQATHNNLNANANIQVGNVDVGNANPVPVSDAGGSLTVDGTVAVSSVGGTVTVTGTVSVNEPVSVDDNGGSLTVDGTVAVSSVGGSVTVAQATHNNLNANANIQVGDVDVGNANPVPVSDAGGSLTVDGNVGIIGNVSVSGDVTVTNLAEGRGVFASAVSKLTDLGTPILGAIDTTAAFLGAEGEYSLFRMDLTGALYTTVSSVSPGGDVGSLGKVAGSGAHNSPTGVLSIAVRADVPQADALGNVYSSLKVDQLGRLHVAKAGGKATYRAATTSSVTVPVGTSLFFVIAGSATRRILPQRITVHCPTLTAIEYNTIVLKRFSTLPTGGTATTLTQTALDPLNSNGAAGLCQVYTAAPTDGTLVGTIGNQRVLLQATTPAAAGTPAAPIEWDFRNVGEGWGPILRQSTQCIGLAFGTAPATAVTLSLEIEWVEEAI